MIRYVKVCPNGHVNDEDSDLCETCVPAYFLGHTSSEPYEDPADAGASQAASIFTTPVATATAAPRAGANDPITRRMDASHALVLQLNGTNELFTLHHGWIIGQHHATSSAHTQVAGVPGVDTVHRQHCKFEQRGEHWFVLPIDQRALGRDYGGNPTMVNGTLVAPGTAQPLRSGDYLTLGAVRFSVR